MRRHGFRNLAPTFKRKAPEQRQGPNDGSSARRLAMRAALTLLYAPAMLLGFNGLAIALVAGRAPYRVRPCGL